jgi:hypothetical protein
MKPNTQDNKPRKLQWKTKVLSGVFDLEFKQYFSNCEDQFNWILINKSLVNRKSFEYILLTFSETREQIETNTAGIIFPWW